jgi:hypothetical protein
MKPFSALGKVGVALLLLNEIRGILVVASILGAWSHAGRAAAPPAPPCAAASHSALGAACRHAIGARRPIQPTDGAARALALHNSKAGR